MRIKGLLFSGLAASAFLAAPAFAQDTATQPTVERPATPAPTPDAPGTRVIQGNLNAAAAGCLPSDHRITLEQGRRYTITARSEAFDTKLTLFSPNCAQQLAENDDSGDGLNSRIDFAAPSNGEYVARVTSFAPDGTGAYTLRVEPSAPLPPLVTRPTRTERGTWRVYEGELSQSDPVDSSRHFDDYELTMTAGQAAMIHLVSTANGENSLDTMLKIYRLDQRGATAVAENDDGGGGTNSFLLFQPEEAGTYVVRVTSFGENATGRYRLRISQ